MLLKKKISGKEEKIIQAKPNRDEPVTAMDKKTQE